LRRRGYGGDGGSRRPLWRRRIPTLLDLEELDEQDIAQIRAPYKDLARQARENDQLGRGTRA
jgi:hypothetical protein